jgi:starch phosphorylase
MCCADFDAYAACLEDAAAVYRQGPAWWSKVVHNVARLGRFSSDETSAQYAAEIWNVKPVPVSLKARDRAAAES